MLLFILVGLAITGPIMAAGVWFGRDTYGISFGIALALSVALWGGFYWMAYGTEDTLTFKVEGKERIQSGDDGKWMIYAVGGETYENTDAWFHGKTHSTDLYRDIVVKHTLRCKVNGFRSGLLSSYKNLLECVDVDTGKKLRA